MVFIETPVFTRQVRELLSDEAYAAFQWHLAVNPRAGEVIQGTGGLRKVRWSAPGSEQTRWRPRDLLSRSRRRPGTVAVDLPQGRERGFDCCGEEDAPSTEPGLVGGFL